MAAGETGVIQKEEISVAPRAGDGASDFVNRSADGALWDEVGAGQAGCPVVAAVGAFEADIASVVVGVAGDAERNELRASEADIVDEEGAKDALRASDRSSCLIIANANSAVANEVSARRTRRTATFSEVASQAGIASLVDIIASGARCDELRAGEADVGHKESIEIAGRAGNCCSRIVQSLTERAVGD